ncbi:MAG: GTPase ObgE [Firmicutes bacterium]|nr:GTPase ObgE [Bacillota bacterium]
MFLDTSTIHAKAGDGGDGGVSFHREKFVMFGGPDGGDGGNGGDIYIEGDPSLNTLISFRYTKKFRAGNGDKGGIKNCYGKRGLDCVIKVPRGTIVKDAESGKIIADIYEDNKPVLILEGGKGGRGNARFATAERQAPAFSELGEKTEERKLFLELKTIADVGIAGFPNVGKSTLLSVISSARPKIGNYPFTTLTPNLGVVAVDDTSFVCADIPGLIEGASEGHGLGHAFLRHIERVRLIVHVLDISPASGREPLDDYFKIRKELTAYSKELALLPEIIVANKTDITENPNKICEKIKKKTGKEVYQISAVTTDGIIALKRAIASLLAELPPLKPIEHEPFAYEKKDIGEIIIEKQNNTFFVYGGMLEIFARKVVLNDPDSFRWFQKVLRDKGVIRMLKEKGLKNLDTVKILDIEFEYLE